MLRFCLIQHVPVWLCDVLQVADGIYQHVDVREEGKENAFSLGHTLWINNEVSCFSPPLLAWTCASELNLHKKKHQCCCGSCMFLKSFFDLLQEFEDLDEITARYIQPMASFARDLLGHKYFQECHGGNKEVHIDLTKYFEVFWIFRFFLWET